MKDDRGWPDVRIGTGSIHAGLCGVLRQFQVIMVRYGQASGSEKSLAISQNISAPSVLKRLQSWLRRYWPALENHGFLVEAGTVREHGSAISARRERKHIANAA